MKKVNLKQGFTLIELLVVVAIIGILASVVLASLNTARSKGNDAAIKANLDNMRAQAAIYYDGAGNQSYGASASCSVTNAGAFGTGCTGMFSDTTIKAGLSAAANASGATVYGFTDSTGGIYEMVAGLKSTSGTYWCVDSSGQSKQETGTVPTTATTGTVCP